MQLRGLIKRRLEVVNLLGESLQQVMTFARISRPRLWMNHGLDYSANMRSYKGAPIDFSASDVGRSYRLHCRTDLKSMPERISASWVGVISIDTASRGYGNLERAWCFESFVPDGQSVAVPVEDLEAIAASVHEQEKMAGRRILRKGCDHQTGKGVETFAKIGRWSVEEHPHEVGKVYHREPPELVLASAIARTR